MPSFGPAQEEQLDRLDRRCPGGVRVVGGLLGGVPRLAQEHLGLRKLPTEEGEVAEHDRPAGARSQRRPARSALGFDVLKAKSYVATYAGNGGYLVARATGALNVVSTSLKPRK